MSSGNVQNDMQWISVTGQVCRKQKHAVAEGRQPPHKRQCILFFVVLMCCLLTDIVDAQIKRCAVNRTERKFMYLCKPIDL